MKKEIKVSLRSIRNFNDFNSLNRVYDGRIRFEFGKKGSILELTDGDNSVSVIAEGSEGALLELLDSYRLCGIA